MLNQIITYEDLLRTHEEYLARELGYADDPVLDYDDLIEMQDDAIEAMCEREYRAERAA